MCSYTIFIAARRSLPFSWPPSAACGWVMKSLITGRPSIRIVIADCSTSNGPPSSPQQIVVMLRDIASEVYTAMRDTAQGEPDTPAAAPNPAGPGCLVGHVAD